MTAAAASIDLKSLEAELARTKNCFDAWARSRMEEALQARDAHAQATQDQSAKLAGLRGRQAQLSVAAQQVKERAEREERETSSLRASAAAAQQEEQAVQQRASLLREQVQQQEQACTQLEEGSNLEEGIKKKKVNALKKALGLYSSRLGLEFRQSDEVLQLVFTQVDVARPSKQFVIGVHVHNGDTCTYKVTECVPALDSLPSLESRLNASNDFSEFVKSVRIAFKALPSGA